MTLSEAVLKKSCKEEIINFSLDYQSKFNFILAGIRYQLSDLKQDYERLGSDLSVAMQVNSVLRERVTSLECHCWSNSQNSRRECLDLTGIPKASDNDALESTRNALVLVAKIARNE